MEGKIGGNCLVCGEDVGSVTCNDGSSPSSFESYFNNLQRSFQGEVNFEGKQLMACEGCSKKISTVQDGQEEVDGLQKEVSILEGNLQQKLLELETAGKSHLSGLKELELLIKNGSQRKDSKDVDYLREEMGKASVSVAKSLKIVEEKMFLARIMTGGAIGAEVESTLGLASAGLDLDPSVVLLAAKNDAKMEGMNELAKVKPEKELIGIVRHGVNCRKGNTFELFPEEIWEMILDQMESKDILTVLRVLPHLDISISNHKRLWYIDQILPFLGNLITNNDVLNLRLVCKQWQSRVDHFLPNQPHYRAYSEDHKNNPKFWSFLDHGFKFNRFKGGSPKISLQSIAESPFSIVDQMMEHPPTRNPFVFRYLFLDISEIDENANGQAEKMFDFLKRCGQHLWFLRVSLVLPVQHTVIKTLIRILKLTGNLKSLSIQLDENEDEERRHIHSCLSGFEKDLPDLPFLETFENGVYPRIFDDNPEEGHEISRGILLHYGPQIKRMQINVNHWRTEYKDLFPNLLELELTFWFEQSESDILKFENLIFGMSSPSLAKVQLDFYNAGDGPISFTIQRDIFKWLKRFPQIKYFELSSEVLDQFIDELRLEADPVKDCIPSIETLKIVDGHGLSYEILHCFPSLRHLQITCYDKPSVVDLSMPDSCVKIREQLQTAKLYDSNIWVLFPNLRKVDLVATNVYKFNRETYECFKNAGKISSEPQLHDLREDIQDFLKSIAEEPMDRFDMLWARIMMRNAENEEDSDDSSSSNESSEYETISEYSGSDSEEN